MVSLFQSVFSCWYDQSCALFCDWILGINAVLFMYFSQAHFTKAVFDFFPPSWKFPHTVFCAFFRKKETSGDANWKKKKNNESRETLMPPKNLSFMSKKQLYVKINDPIVLQCYKICRTYQQNTKKKTS